MPATIVRGVQGAPGTIGYQNGLTSSVFNELNFVIPKYDSKLKQKFGNSYVIMSQLLGNSVLKEEMTTTNTYSHFEQGRYFGVVLVNANVTGVVSGANVTFVCKSPESYNDGVTGTQAPIAEGQTVRIRSNGVKGNVVSVTRTAGAWSVVVSPLGSTFFRTGTSGTQLNAGEGIEIFGGTQLAGEASTAGKTIKPKLYRYDNTCTTIRSDYRVTDFTSMQQTQVDFGGGNQYIEKLAVDNMNISMLEKMDDALFEGVPYANTANIGTIGVIPEIESRGGEVNYLTGSAYGIADFQRITRTIDWNGGPDEYHMLQDIYQRQAMNTSLFGLYPNGMISYGSVGFGSEAAVSYGFKSFSTDTVSFHFHRSKCFGAEAKFGYTPTQGDFRANYGLCIPQGKLRDTKTGESYPYLQQVFKKHPRISEKIYGWSVGYTQGTKTLEASDNFAQICYFGSRVVSAEQFIINKGVAA